MIASLSQLLQTVVDEDKRILDAAAKSHGSAEQLRRSILRIEQSIKQCQTRKMEAYEKYSDGKITRDEFIRFRDQLVSETETMTAEKNSLEERLALLEQSQSTELHDLAESALQFLKATDVTNEMLRGFIDRVLVFTGGRGEIVYQFNNPFEDTAQDTK